ncbi:hypothetical protein ACQYWQ_21190 [Streptomyces sp. P6-2-1]|uniref:hypothetical protein n=1 Tax=unclassified Streptomyces TaxID=2593676 RepID=UPI003D35D4BF
MSSFNTITKLTAPTVVASRSLSISVLGTGLSGVSGLSAFSFPGLSFGRPEEKKRDERPTQAPAAVVTEQAHAYPIAAAGAGNPMTQHHTMWAFRGLEPWSDPV